MSDNYIFRTEEKEENTILQPQHASDEIID